MPCNGIRLGEALLELWPKDDDQRREWCVSQGVILDSHCCLGMAYAISKPLLTPHQGPNRIVDWIASWSEYRIPVPYDGYASAILRFCPWCGSSLPRSRKEEWYQTLYELGFTDPGEQDIRLPSTQIRGGATAAGNLARSRMSASGRRRP
jgi:hypothetical protein